MPCGAELSVIIPSYRSDATLVRVLAALRPQLEARTEVVVVESSGLEQAAALQAREPWLRVVGARDRLLPGEARNRGVQEAHGSLLAFIDADAVPDPGWLARLRVGLDGGRAVAAAGAVRNGTPRDAIGTASYLLEFSEWTPGRRGRPLHGATCNMLVRREAFERAGGFDEDVWPGEDTIMTVPWGHENRLAFVPDAAVWHLNRTHLDDLVRHQFRLGRSFAAVCDRVEFPHRRFSRWPLLVSAPALRLGALGLRLAGQPALLRAAARVSPLLIFGLGVWTAGVAAARASASASTAREV
jgi:glycosyltransferase involved in cell wall biosynthesis